MQDKFHVGITSRVRWMFEAFGPDKKLKWADFIDPNLVVNEGLNYGLDVYYGVVAKPTAWYVGLITGPGATVIAGDTAASHGFTENTTYSEGTRPTCQFGSASSQSITNSSNKASFSITGTVTIGGAFLISENTKGGASGKLNSGGAFTGGDKSLGNGDTLQVTVTCTHADDGV
jgi:hypothetical protein